VRVVRPYFDATPNSPLEAFAAEASRPRTIVSHTGSRNAALVGKLDLCQHESVELGAEHIDLANEAVVDRHLEAPLANCPPRRVASLDELAVLVGLESAPRTIVVPGGAVRSRRPVMGLSSGMLSATGDDAFGSTMRSVGWRSGLTGLP
jgi:hypothetical protein